MSQQTDNLNIAIQEFLSSIGATNLKPTKIIFEEKSSESIIPMRTNCWEWDPAVQELVWVCN
ncbi:hypothetical protein ACFO3O_09205 [Dokdonia ponticola]|uniref:Uncharacterized protein n=1 Tax=Dokdonia ponticola TaxID=2041041 RepID=A0ABV9HX50_9FLAO